jgi:diketogulonate reductase-like aldo/keto reductase
LYGFAKVSPVVIQNRFYTNSGYDKAIREFCNQKGIIYQSFWTLSANPHILVDSKIIASAKKYRCHPAQVFFRYLTQIGIVPLTGTTSEIHMKEDLAIFDFELEPDECSAIEGLF